VCDALHEWGPHGFALALPDSQARIMQNLSGPMHARDVRNVVPIESSREQSLCDLKPFPLKFKTTVTRRGTR